eukprot:COSAG01_NODE_33067_length_570_cov_2.199575_1_plen_82_part_00
MLEKPPGVPSSHRADLARAAAAAAARLLNHSLRAVQHAPQAPACTRQSVNILESSDPVTNRHELSSHQAAALLPRGILLNL